MSKKLIGKERQRKRKKSRNTKHERVSFVLMNKDGRVLTLSDQHKLWNLAPNMVHEDDYVPMFCVLCGEVMNSIHDTHNPGPLTDDCTAKHAHETNEKNRCCTVCNDTKVWTAREEIISSGVHSDWLDARVVTDDLKSVLKRVGDHESN